MPEKMEMDSSLPFTREQFQAAYALNLCTVSVSQIIAYNDPEILEQEYETILNNLNLEYMPKDDALLEIAKRALEKETGARGLRAVIEEYMLDIMYEVPKDDNIGEVVITKDYIEGKGGPEIKMREFVVPGIDNARTYLIG